MTITLPEILVSTYDYELPDFKKVNIDQLRTDIEEACVANLDLVDSIAANTEPATFHNTVEPLDAGSVVLSRLVSLLFNIGATESTEEIRDTEEWAQGRLAQHKSAVGAHRGLAERVTAVKESADFDSLTDSQQRLVRELDKDLRHAGSTLTGAALAELQQIDARVSVLQAQFSKKLLAGMSEAGVHATQREQLAGLPQDQVESAAAAAKAKGLEGWWLGLELPIMQPALATLSNRETRLALHNASVRRCHAGAADTSELVLELAKLRAKRAELLGYGNHAEYELASQTAPDTATVRAMLQQMINPAVVNARKDAEGLIKAAEADGITDFTAHDWLYYANKNTADGPGVDDEEVKPYFELNNIIDEGILRAATMLYGVQFVKRTDLPAYADDVMIVEMQDKDGSGMGLILMDWYARDSKRGGAWMSSFVDQSHSLGTKPVTTFNLNLRRPIAGAPTLLTYDEVVTAFHEFGHVLHGMLSQVHYWQQSGTSVPRDFVEFPSQVNEYWARHPKVLPHFAKHHATGDVMPEALQEKVRHSGSVVFARDTVEILGAAILDWEWHNLSSAEADAVTDIDAFEKSVFEKWSIPTELIPSRYQSRFFMHIFEGGYAAGYYSYLWSEVLDADACNWFDSFGDELGKAGQLLRDNVLAVGSSQDPLLGYTSIVGRKPEMEPLLQRYQLV